MLPLLPATIVLLTFSAYATAQQFTSHPLVAQVTNEGFTVDAGDPIQLRGPLVTPEMLAEEQRQAFSDLVGSRRMKKHLQDSIVAPFKLNIQTIRKTDNNATVRSLDLYFVARGDLEIINQKDLLSSLMAGDQKPKSAEEGGFETYAKPVDPNAAPAEGAPPKGELVESLYKYRFPILEKVVVSGLVRGAGLYVDKALVQSAITPTDLLDDPQNPTRWRAIPRGVKTDAGLGPPEPFRGFVCYLQATQLAFVPESVLIECHAAYVEPYGWFNGRNLLASKLPLLMQQSVRDFRRKLKEVQQEGR